MHRSLSIASFILLASSLAACGGGGGGAAGGAGVVPTAPQPTPTPPITSPQNIVIAGTVSHLAGSLSSTTWNIPAPTGCPSATNTTLSCASYPSAPAQLPNASATPQAGAAIGGATVYLVAAAQNAVAGLPSAPIAQATTATDGSFTFTVSSSQGSQFGVIAFYGSTFNQSTGASDTGYTLAHAVASAGSKAALYVDQLSGDEQSALATLNADRQAATLAPVTTDTMAQAAARLGIAQVVGATSCPSQSSVAQVNAAYKAFGGVGSGALAWADTAATQWAAAVNYGSPWNNTQATIAGLAAVYQAAPCGTGYTTPINYFDAIYIY